MLSHLHRFGGRSAIGATADRPPSRYASERCQSERPMPRVARHRMQKRYHQLVVPGQGNPLGAGALEDIQKSAVLLIKVYVGRGQAVEELRIRRAARLRDRADVLLGR